ncbi:MAG: hypothetical protein IH941_05330 [Acidobacteria bacterium]|nr:hypothetical protein [Acidobacteriota bacterium]
MAKATTARKKADPALQRRKTQLAQIREAIEGLKTKLQQRSEASENRGLLQSVSLGMYEEIEKLTKKAPAELVTELVLEQVNDLIGEAKQLMKEDRYVQKLNQFVPAGDLPELRDVLFVLRQVRQGLERFDPKVGYVRILLREATIVEGALILYLDGLRSEYLYKELKERFVLSELADIWRQKVGGYGGKAFNFDHLDSIDIQEHFSVT